LIAWDVAASQIQLAWHARLYGVTAISGQIRLRAGDCNRYQITLYDELFPLTAARCSRCFSSNLLVTTTEVMPEVLAEAGLTLVQTFSL